MVDEQAKPDNARLNPRVSIIIPTYNWSSVLPFSIGSVLRQTFADFELLVIGDCCTDDSGEVVGSNGDGRIRWINLPVNCGHQSGPNNHGLSEARGKYIAYLGHDDLWLPRHLEFAVGKLDSGADLVYGITEMVAPGNEPPRFEPLELGDYVPGMWIPPSGVVHRRDVARRIGGWRHFRDVAKDPEADLWERIHGAGGQIEFVRRLTAIKFPALQRRNVYAQRPCHEQSAWSKRLEMEVDFEATELARLVVPRIGDRPWRPFRESLAEFRDDVRGRIRRRLIAAGIVRPNTAADRHREYHARRAFKGVK